MNATTPRRLEIFFSYAHEDEGLVGEVRSQLSVYDRQKVIRSWHDREIPPGAEWKGVIDRHLATCDIVLLFVSPAFFESDYCYDVEMSEALSRHASGRLRVIPVILRPCPWESAPFAFLQVLPREGQPVTRWTDRDEACLNVAEGVMRAVRELSATAGPRSADGADASADACEDLDCEPVVMSARPVVPQSTMPDVASLQCPSGACRSADVQLSDAVKIVSLDADADGWVGRGVVRVDYAVDGHCLTCGRMFEVARRAIPLSFPELACNECGRQAFLTYKPTGFRNVEGGYEFGVEIRCSECQGARRFTRLIGSLLRTVGIELRPSGMTVRQAADAGQG